MDIAIVTGAPLQVLSLLEAKHHFDIDPRNLAVFTTSYGHRLIDSLDSDLGEIHELPYRMGGEPGLRSIVRSKFSIHRCIARVRHVTGGRLINRLLLGTTGHLWAAATAHVPRRTIVVLEDGSASLKDPAARRRQVTTRPSVAVRGRRMLLAAVGIPDQPVPPAVFFTPYNLEVGPDDVLVRHDFPHIREMYDDKPVAADLNLVLGTYLRSADEARHQAWSARYGGVLKELQASRPEDRWLYKPHPADGRGGFGIFTNPLPKMPPVEIALAAADELPSRVFAFGSSALDSLGLVLPSEVSMWDLRDRLA